MNYIIISVACGLFSAVVWKLSAMRIMKLHSHRVENAAALSTAAMFFSGILAVAPVLMLNSLIDGKVNMWIWLGAFAVFWFILGKLFER
ncbi:MAG: hypothetical protein SNJ70_08565 [Armatimonadota bacterium]